MNRHEIAYILEGKEVKSVTLREWSAWFEAAGDKRIVKQENLPTGERVSTVFLGIDSGWGNEKPQLFETMIFGGVHNEYQERYSTWDEAEAGHKRAVEMIFA